MLLIKGDVMENLLQKIIQKSESIGRWKEFLDKLEDWSNPYVTIAQNHIKTFEKERNEYINELYEKIKGK
jgi:hypothetical protein